MNKGPDSADNRFKDAMAQAPVAICALKGPGHVVEMVNARMLEIWGRQEHEALNKGVFDAMPETASQGYEEMLDGVYSSGKSFSASEVQLVILRNGVLRPIYVNFVFEPFRNEEGSVTGITIVATEVTELVESKKALEASEARIRSLVQQTPVAMTVLRGHDLIVEMCNEAMYKKIWRRPEQEIMGKKMPEIISMTDTGLVVERIRAVMKTGQTHKDPEVRLWKDPDSYREGTKPVFMSYEYSPLVGPEGSVTGVLITALDVTEHLENRAKAEDAAERLLLATEGTQTATWDLDLVTKKLIHSTRLSQIFGRDELSVFSQEDFRSQLHPDDRNSIVDPAFAKAMVEGIYYYEARIYLPDGDLRWIKTRGKVVFDPNGIPVRMLGTIIDMTDQRNAEENFVKLAAIVQSSDDAIISKRLDGTIVSWNDSARRIFGYTAEEMIGLSVSKLIPHDRQNEEPEIIKRLRLGERVQHFETQRITKDGKLLDLSLTISPIRDHTGQIIGASKIARDISSQRQAEKIISENEERLKIILDASELGTYELNIKTQDISYSAKYAEMLGHTKEGKAEYHELVKRLYKEDLPARAEAYKEAFETGVLHYETRVMRDDGSIGWIEAKGRIFYDAFGKPEKLIGTSRDITDEKLYQERLEESEKRFKSVADTAPVMIWLTDLDKKAVFLNKSWSDFTGISIEEGLGNGWTKVVHPSDIAATSAAFSSAYETRTNYNKELRIRFKNGKYRWVQDHAVPRYDSEGTFIGFIGTSVDIEEQRNAKTILENKVEERTADLVDANEQLLKTNHELEQFAYVSSHDLQEPLRKIMTFSEMLSSAIDLEGKPKEYVEKINASAQRMSNLIKDLLNYSRLSKSDDRFVKTDLNEVLKNVKNDFEILVMQKNAVIKNMELPVIRAIPVQINQLFYNLVNNSLKFSEREPLIEITSEPVTEEEQKNIPGLRPEDSYIHLIFKDNGIGFSQEHADQIFVIFQRLNDKQRYSGTGIGLAICKKIVENHHGYISASGEPGKGARFDIYLPV